MMYVVITAIIAFSSLFSTSRGCATSWNPKNITISNVSSTFELSFPNPNDINDYRLDVVYTWNLQDTDTENDFEGFVITFFDSGETSASNLKKRNDVFDLDDQDNLDPMYIPGFNNRFLPISLSEIERDTCKDVKGKEIWGVDSNGDPKNCSIPCPEYMETPCNFSQLCMQMAKKNTKALNKNAREFRHSISFGRFYDFKISLYDNWDINKETQFNFKAPFCLEETIENFNFSKTVAHKFCELEQNISASYAASGPVIGVYLESITPQLENRQEAVALIRFRNPHDIAKNMVLEKFAINHKQDGHVNNSEVLADEIGSDGYYNLYIYHLLLGQSYVVHILPSLKYIECQPTPLTKCDTFQHGASRSFTFNVPDINVCTNDKEERDKWVGDHLYCDVNAFCYDNGPEKESPGICVCKRGYAGNGISTVWGFEGCKNDDECLNNTVCADKANCLDLIAPSTGVECSCKPGYYGDGYRNGTDCQSISYVVSLSVAIPLSILFVSAIVFVIWKCRIMKKRTLDRAFSKFIVNTNKEANYFSPMVLSNNHLKSNGQQGLIDQKYEIDDKNITFGGVIGRGNFGVVYKGNLKTDNGIQDVAVKIISNATSMEVRDEFLAEILLISTIGNHDNVLGMIGCCTKGDRLCLVMEFLKYGDLLHFLWQAREVTPDSDPIYVLTEREMFHIGSQVAQGMAYLRNMKIIHGDIAARNILVGENLACKISDFGLANDVYRYGVIKGSTERKVPYKWISPERMMMGKVPITWKSDVWSFGILLYEMITLGAAPYNETPQQQLFHKLQSGYRMSRPASCSENLYNIMKSCWEWVPSKRPSFKELHSHLQLKQTDSNYVNLLLMVDVLDEASYSAANQQREENSVSDIPANNDADISISSQQSNNNISGGTLYNDFAV